MDQEFLQQLEEQFTNVGVEKIWKRKIGERTIWFSPISNVGQEKVNQTLSRQDLGPNILIESKKVTLSFSIVGIDDVDLTDYRNAGPVFPSVNKEGKTVKVSLDMYIYNKFRTWGGQFIEDAFDIFADLMETYTKENLKDIKFDNAKDPAVELAELEERVSELRKVLGKPDLVESMGESSDGSKEEKIESDEQELPDDVQEQEFVPEKVNMFKTVREDGVPEHVKRAESELRKIRSGKSFEEELLDKRKKDLSSIEPVITERTKKLIEASQDDVLDFRQVPSRDPILIDPKPSNINPRFSKQK